MTGHHDTHSFFPTGGWGYKWLPEPDGGYGQEQPGSWIYGILEYLEQGAIRSLGEGQTGDARAAALRLLMITPITVLNCPSRRTARAYPLVRASSDVYNSLSEGLTTDPGASYRSDYAACMSGGTLETYAQLQAAGQTVESRRYEPQDGPGPENFTDADNWERPRTDGLAVWVLNGGDKNGVIFARNPVSMRRITDGTSRTYLVAERMREVDHYETGESRFDDQSAYNGFDRDNQVSAFVAPLADMTSDQYQLWRRDVFRNQGEIHAEQFNTGSAHPGVFLALFCDSSVRSISYDVDLETHRAAGSRDGQELIGDR